MKISKFTGKFENIIKVKPMKKRILLFSMTCFVLCTISTGIGYSQDWPQFRGIGRDGKVTGFKAPASWPAELAQQWKVTVGFGDATPALVGKMIYLNTRQGDDEVILCLDAATGKELWKNTYPSAAVTGPSGSHPGPRSSPVVASGKISFIFK